MSSPRQTLAVFLVTAAVIVVIVAMFVVPDFSVKKCSPNVEPSTSPGHWFCSDTITLPALSSGCSQGNTTVSAPAVAVSYEGVLFHAHIFARCIEPFNLGLNVSIFTSNDEAYSVSNWSVGGVFFDSWWNWTTPGNQSGLQWRGNYTLALLVAD